MARSPRTRSRRARRERAARIEALGVGEAVEAPCRARHPTPPGRGSWVDGVLHIPGPDGGEATFVVDDPREVALVTRQGRAPVALDPPLEVQVREVRYKAETFYGSDGQIIVVTSPRRTLEIALPSEEVEPVARRLSDLG
ncbi:MAG: hypothetical protein ACR2JF_04340 [Iamia sp.]